MILYTPLPQWQILPPYEPKFQVRQEGGRYLVGEETEEGFVLQRLISTDLRDYLSPDYAPGSRYNKSR